MKAKPTTTKPAKLIKTPAKLLALIREQADKAGEGQTWIAKLPDDLRNDLYEVIGEFIAGNLGTGYSKAQMLRDINASGLVPCKVSKSNLRTLIEHYRRKNGDISHD